MEIGPWILRGHPRLDRRPTDLDVLLDEGQRLAAGNVNLAVDQVDSRHELRYTVLHLQAGIHLQEVELPRLRIEEELGRAGAAIADLECEADCAVGDGSANRFRQRRCRRLFDELLMPALYGTIAVANVYDVTVRIGQHLDLDVTSAIHVAFQIDFAAAESGVGFPGCFLQRGFELFGFPNDPHSAAAAPEGGFDNQRIAD